MFAFGVSSRMRCLARSVLLFENADYVAQRRTGQRAIHAVSQPYFLGGPRALQAPCYSRIFAWALGEANARGSPVGLGAVWRGATTNVEGPTGAHADFGGDRCHEPKFSAFSSHSPTQAPIPSWTLVVATHFSSPRCSNTILHRISSTPLPRECSP